MCNILLSKLVENMFSLFVIYIFNILYVSDKIITFKCCYSLLNYGVSVEMTHVVIID